MADQHLPDSNVQKIPKIRREYIQTPAHLDILTRCYGTMQETISSPTHSELVEMGLIQWSDSGECWDTTERGNLHIEQLLQIPLPQKIWVTASGQPMTHED